MAEIFHTLPIEAKPKQVYRAITEQDGLRSWWTRFTMAEPTVGFVNEFGFGGEFKFRMRIDDLERDEGIFWTCIAGHDEWEGTQIAFRLKPLPDKRGTLLRFEHTNWGSSEGVLPQCNYDWAQYLRSLKLYLEKGKGTPS